MKGLFQKYLYDYWSLVNLIFLNLTFFMLVLEFILKSKGDLPFMLWFLRRANCWEVYHVS